MVRMVMCKGTWPENNCADFEVFEVREGETDEQAIARAGVAYSVDDEFYIVEKAIGRIKTMKCSCCGGITRGRQWHNRDTGYGLCNDCIDFCHSNIDDEEMKRLYGERGVHYDVQEGKS